MKLASSIAAVTALMALASTSAQAQTTPSPTPAPAASASSTTTQPTYRVRSANDIQPYSELRYIHLAEYDSQYNGQFARYQRQSAKSYGAALDTARCAVEIDRGGKFSSYFGQDSVAFGDMIQRVKRGYRGCIRRAGQSDPVFYPAAFAEALIVKDEATYSDRAMAVNVDQADAFIGENDDDIGILDKVARCMVVYSPGLAMKLFKSEVGSADETERLNAMYASTPECRNSSSPKGVTTALQRAAIAYAFYNWKQRSA